MEIEDACERVWARRLALLLFLAAPATLSSCGAGVAAVAASTGGSSGGSTPALNTFVVESPKVSPARLVLDASQAVQVSLSYDAGQGELPMRMLRGPGVTGSEVSLAAGPNPAIEWDFASELGAASFQDGVRLFAKRGGTTISGGELTLGMGNDPPGIRSIQPVTGASSEAAGNVEVELEVSDSSSDLVSILVDWRRASDAPEDWKPATVGGVPEAVGTNPNGVSFSFFWKTEDDGLGSADADFVLRITADDGTLDGMTSVGLTRLEGPSFRVDNNEEPIVQLFNDAVISNPDERRGIPIPFRVIDEEEDLVEVLFQWRREGEEFPSLDMDGDGKIENAEIDAILSDSVLRQEHHICTEYPHFAEGRIVPIDADMVRLPELASSQSWILASGIVGKTLELLRPSSIPSPITPRWRSNPLISPIAALPVGDGLTAVVLDVPGASRLREIELATGHVVREIATLGQGIPSAMAFEKREKAVLIALDDAGTWRIERVELATGAIAELIVSDGTEPAPVRGIASLGTNAAVFTAGTSLFHLDYRDPLAPQLGRLLTGLASPWGVVVDPLPPDRIYLAEHDANRVLAVELDSHGKSPVVVNTAPMQPGTLDAPRALALERHGSRMLIVTSAPGGGDQLQGLDLGATGGNLSFPIGAATAANVASVATGPDGLRLLCLSSSNDLAAAGGIEQRRVIASHSPSSQDVSVEPPLDPLLTPGQLWRTSEEVFPLRATALGSAGRFLWDSREAPGSTFLRAIARDEEIGTAADGAAPKRVRGELEVEPLPLGSPGVTNDSRSVATADLDGDGDWDLVSANSGDNNLTIFFQLSPGSFSASPLALGGPGVTNDPRSVAAADLDGDGDWDIVSANSGDNNLTIFFQLSPGSFSASPHALGGPGLTNDPRSVATADLDGDGDQDLVSANLNSSNLTVFRQLTPGCFASSPIVIGGFPVTGHPASVAVADFDSDGDQDLVSANEFRSDLTVFFQLSPGSFSASPLALGGPGVTFRPASVAAADLDGDGDQDLVSANNLGSDLTVFFQLSPGSFSASPLALGGPGVTFRPASVAAADLDGDGDQDLVSASNLGSDLTVFFQLSPGNFSASPLVLGGLEVTSSASSVAAADLDGDGDQDLVSANKSGSDLTVFFQHSPGSLSASPLALGGPNVTLTPASVAAADLDEDGDLDIVSANLDGHNLTVFFQLSPGSFSASPLVLGGPGLTPTSVAAADLDGDGDQDIVSANSDFFGVELEHLTIFFQLSPGSFSASPLALGGFRVTRNPVSVAAADLDGDCDLDIVSANQNGPNLTVFFQLSPGSFLPSPLALGGPNVTLTPVSVAAADLDEDGDLEIVSANLDGHNLTVFFQLSPGSFSASPLVLGGPGVTDFPLSVAAADLDGDGDKDLVSANSENLTVFFQLSPGSFKASPLTFGPGGLSVAAVDLDGDGDKDLVSANSTSNNLTVFLQLSPGSFSAFPLAIGGPGVTSAPFSIAAADLDGDGDQDIVSANFNVSNLTVFFGGR